MSSDPSFGYEAIAKQFMAVRSGTGRDFIDSWTETLLANCSIVDIGAGHGDPLTSVLIEKGFDVWAIDASPTLADAFVQKFPEVPIACEAAETSSFFNRKFDAALMVGLIFLLPEAKQKALLKRVAEALNDEGRLLFSAPWQITNWEDVLTGQTSYSLGKDAYEGVLSDVGLTVKNTFEDEGGTHYFEAVKS